MENLKAIDLAYWQQDSWQLYAADGYGLKLLANFEGFLKVMKDNKVLFKGQNRREAVQVFNNNIKRNKQ